MLFAILFAVVQYVRPHDILVREDGVDRKYDVVDTCDITRRKDGNIDFKLSISAVNGHSCEMEGTAAKTGDHFEYSEILDAYPEKPHCTLKIEFNSKRAIVTDVGDVCRRAWCGARASIGRTEFQKRGAKKR